MIDSFSKQLMGPDQVLRFLENLDMPDEGSNTLYLKKGSKMLEFIKVTTKMAENFQHNSVSALKDLVGSLTGGGVLFWTEALYILIVPPFPIAKYDRFEFKAIGPLRDLLLREHLVAALLLRLGKCAIGVFHGNRLISSKTDSYLVHSRHRAGGSSQARFARRRIEQSNIFYRRTCLVLQEKLANYEDNLESFFLGGEKTTLEGFRRQCKYLGRFNERIHRRVLNTREPSHKSLLNLPNSISKSEVYIFDVKLMNQDP